jgi:hypothetical protein
MNLQEAISSIKTTIENAIIRDGEDGKNRLIRSQKPIKLIHEVVKSELILNGIEPNRIRPALNNRRGEIRVAGFLKRKSQDICVLPDNVSSQSETLMYGLLLGEVDEFGENYTERIISINVRSQLSSLAKNFDTLYERTFAEALNLHLRCPKMCLGEVYLIPVYEYNAEAAKNHEIEFVKDIGNVEKYLLAFDAVNGRDDEKGELYKYEKVCLLVVDFNKNTPQIYNSDEELQNENLLSKHSSASIGSLNFSRFIPDLLNVYRHRFPPN